MFARKRGFSGTGGTDEHNKGQLWHSNFHVKRSSWILGKNGHLRWRTKLRVFLADRNKANLVSEAVAYSLCPGLKFRTGPLKAMVFVAHRSGRESFKFDVVFLIGSGDDNCLWFREFEEDALKRG